MSTTVHNYSELAYYFDVNHPTEELISRKLYKLTNCGAWLQFSKFENTVANVKQRWHFMLNPHWNRDRESIPVHSVKAGGSWNKGKREWKAPSEAGIPDAVSEFLQIVTDRANNYYMTDISWNQLQDIAVKRANVWVHGTVLTVYLSVPVTKTVLGITIGSIVEGVDFDASPVDLQFPFTIEELDKAIQSVEDECEYIWQQTHGCEDCNTPGEWGHDAINPNCPTCRGEGIII